MFTLPTTRIFSKTSAWRVGFLGCVQGHGECISARLPGYLCLAGNTFPLDSMKAGP